MDARTSRYHEVYARSMRDPEGFWGEAARAIDWYEPATKVFDKDAGGKSACNGPCAAIWPPLLVTGDGKASGDWTIVARDDGTKQWAFKGKPVYKYSKDTKAGETTGDGFNGVWHAVKG